MRIFLKKFPLVVLLLCMLFGIAACREAITMDSGFRTTKPDALFLSFDPATIFNDIANGTADFTSLEESRSGEVPGGDPFSWSQAEYYEILKLPLFSLASESPKNIRHQCIDFSYHLSNSP